MAGFDDDPLTPGCYSQLLFSEEISGLETDFGFSSSFSSDDNSSKTNTAPKMLCFGDYAKHCNLKVRVENGNKTGQVSGSTACMDLSSEKNKINTLPKSNKKRNGSGIHDPGDGSGAPTTSQRSSKKSKSEHSTGHAKVVKKEKLGERITALQQLVSPFGKTDTASVLHEALGYIRFLQDQVQVLCSPYLQRSSPASSTPHGHDDGGNVESEHIKTRDLRSRGLCLIPMELTLHVADSNGADLWSSAGMVDSISSG